MTSGPVPSTCTEKRDGTKGAASVADGAQPNTPSAIAAIMNLRRFMLVM